MFRALSSISEGEGDLNTARSTLVPLQFKGKKPVADAPRGGHGPRLHSVHLLTRGALQELPGRAVDQLAETVSVVSVATLGQRQRGLVLLSQTDVALLPLPAVSSPTSPGHGVRANQVASTGPGCWLRGGHVARTWG